MAKSFSLRFTTPPGNSQYVVPWDSTRGIDGALSTSQSSNPAPGGKRGRFGQKVIKYTIKTTTQNVTVDEQLLTGNAGTNADWETTAVGNFTVTAGTTASREFKTMNPDQRILVSAGATGPATLVFYGEITDSADFGS